MSIFKKAPFKYVNEFLNSTIKELFATPEFASAVTEVVPGPSYKVYSATLTQTGTNAPVASVKENTIGPLTWAYSMFAPGAYEVTGNLPLGKCVVIAGPPNTFGPFSNVVLGTFDQVFNNKIIIKSTNSAGTMQNDLLSNHFIEIRVYE